MTNDKAIIDISARNKAMILAIPKGKLIKSKIK
jgi:hypothetical protein